MNHANILIVDDESLVRWSLKERLEAQGYDLIEAETAAEALRQPLFFLVRGRNVIHRPISNLTPFLSGISAPVCD